MSADHDRVETAAGSDPSSSVFPRSWGRPPDGQFSPERERWVLSRVREHRQTAPRRAAELRVRQLVARDRRLAVELRLRRHELTSLRHRLLTARRDGPR